MQYRNVGKAGIKVSEIALGSWMTRLEDTAAVENAAQIVRKAWEAGVNFFDCADAYSGGDAEIFLGRVLKEYPARRGGRLQQGVLPDRPRCEPAWPVPQAHPG